MFSGKGDPRNSTLGAAIIHFFGGIHEIYFPNVLMKLSLLLAVIAGGMIGIFTFVITDAGLVVTLSPGSIIVLLSMILRGGSLLFLHC